ncbi:UNVERIFIED_CONTAM: Chromatin modification-related protein EAF1 B [Sesamum latifolium]|uniref:Chromatin modification-related protein EAF1 B n=1 Tax=Sesamum latifolium TaxID=2727402 RepID=A0AAW2Y3Z7_9LAMI
MHGCSSLSVLLVNAEIDSMGGVVEGGVGIANKTSPRRAAIEKVQAELRQEYDVREKRKKELEFLEKGGDPLDFKHGNAASVSVQSTSFTDQHPEQLLTSEARGSFAITASPHGDSVESSGRLGANLSEPNSADNLMLFDAEHECSEGDRNSLHPGRSTIVPTEKLSQMDGSQRTREHGDSPAFGLPRKAYKRRNRSRPNRDGTRSSSTDVNSTRASHGSSIPSRQGSREVKGFISDAENQNISSNCKTKPTSPVDGGVHKSGLPDSQQDLELDGGKAVESSKNMVEGVPKVAVSDAIASETPLDDQHNQYSNSGAVKTSVQMGSNGPESIQAMEEMNSAVIECQPSTTAIKFENQSSSCHMNGFSSKREDGMKSDAHINSVSRGIKGLDSESSCTQTSLSIGGNNDTDMFNKMGDADSNGKIKDQTSIPDGTLVGQGDEFVKEKNETEAVGSSTHVNAENTCQSQQENGCKLQPEEVLTQSASASIIEAKDHVVAEEREACGHTGSESGKKPSDTLGDNPGRHNENSCNVRLQDSINISISDLPKDGMLTRLPSVSLEAQTSCGSDSKLARKIDEDSILKEAQIIEAKRKRISELSVATSPKQIRLKSHWDYVLEEMAWLANDFAQERVWKIAAAAQISSRAAFTCRLRKQEKSSGMEAKKVAHTLAKSVMEFWHSVEETSKVLEQQSQRDEAVAVKAYAVRFLKYNNSNNVHNQAEVPLTPDRVSDMGIIDLSWEDNLTEENLFYTVPPGAMEMYKSSIEFYVSQCERIGSSMQEEVETSACDATADFGSQDNAYDEDEEMNTYDMPMGFEASKSSRLGQKKRKHLTHAYGVRSYEGSSGILPMQCAENKAMAEQSALLAKRPGGSLNVSIPTKRVRTASRRVISPFSAGASGCIQNVAYEPRWQVDSTFQNEQFQRDHLKKSHQLESNGSSGLLGQPMIKKPKTMRQSQDNSFENVAPIGGSVPSPVASQMSNMSNPNKFIKILGGRDRGRKPKVLKMPAGQPSSGSPWTLFEDQALVVLVHDMGPNWELISDAINSTLQFKCIFRKAKECKERHNFLMDRTSGDGADSAEDSGSSQPYPSTLPGIPKGSARQLFQRLQGPMEEDTLKSHFEKIIIIGQKQHYRKTQNDNQDPKPLQQPHSSHTTAFSQICPNNLNGGPILTPLDLCDASIPGPDLLSVGYQGPHSGGLAIPNQSTVTPMYPASGACSALQGSPNMMLGNSFSSSPGSLSSSVRDGRYGVPRSASLSADEHQRMQQYNQMISSRSMTPPNISNGALPGADRGVRVLTGGSGMGLASAVNRSMPMARPGYQGIAPSSSVVSPVMSSANMHSGMGSGQGSSVLRPRETMHMIRPGLAQDSQRQMMVPDLQMQVSPRNSKGVSPFGGLSSPFPNQTASPPVSSYPLHHQQSHPISPQQPQVLSPHHPHFQGPANHSPNPQQQAYAIRMAKERQQHRYLQQQPQQQLQQPQFAASSSLMSHVQSQSQLPLSSPVQNSSQVQPQTGSPAVSLSSLTSASSMNSSMPQHQQKHQSSTQGVVRHAQSGGSGLTNQSGKQRQRQQQQQFPQTNRQHPQQRQQPQAQQPAKVVKGVGRGNMMMHQNMPIDPSLVNGVTTNPVNQCLEKGEATAHLMQSQGVYTSSALNAVQPTRQYVSSQSSNQSLSQQKIYSGPTASSTKQVHQMNAHSDSSSQGHVPAVAPGLSAGHQSVPSLAMSGSNHQQAPTQQKLVNQSQLALQRVVQPNRQLNSDPTNKPQVRDSDTDQHPTSSSTEMDTMTAVPQGTNIATNVAQVGQGLGQRPSSANLTSIRHDVSAQWQQQPSQLQQPNSPVPHPQQNKQPLPPVHSQQQGQLLQAGNGNLYGRPGDHRLE